MTLPQDIDRELQPEEYETLCEKVFGEFKQGFTVKKITRTKSGLTIEVQLDDRTNHDITI